MKITLRNIRPPIWRRVQLPGNATLALVHEVIQTAMGWTNSHLHCFRVGETTFSMPYPGAGFAEGGDKDSRNVRLDEIVHRTKAKFLYEYDFGDSWQHEILVEKIVEPEAGVRYPRCLAGQRACPPEDCGGAWGYLDLLECLSDPNHEEHEEKKDWIGGDWDAEAFDLESINRRLARLSKPGPRRRAADSGLR